MHSIYDLDYCLQRVSEGQKYARKMFDFGMKLDWEAEDKNGEKLVKHPGVDAVLLYAERMIYED